MRRSLSLLCVGLVLSGCGQAWQAPANVADLNAGKGYMAERRDVPLVIDAEAADAIRWNERECVARPAAWAGPAPAIGDAQIPLAPGDLVRLALPGNEAPSGLFKVNTDFTVSFDQIGELNVRGLTIQQAEATLTRQLVSTGYYRAGHAHVGLKLIDGGPVRVRVSGAVFQPGVVTINQKGAAERDPARDTAAGDHPIGRAVSNALASASGVRPDADIARVTVLRAGQRREVDLTGLLTGAPAENLLLTEGDQVEVPSRGCFQSALARPSPITPPGVRTFISNLTVPASSNASSAVNHDAVNFPYGTTLLQALVSGNCIGGIQSTNADRFGVLISLNPITGRFEVIERRVEELVRRADRDAFNPYIMPNDAIACYDSGVTNLRDLARSVTDSLLGGVVKL